MLEVKTRLVPTEDSFTKSAILIACMSTVVTIEPTVAINVVIVVAAVIAVAVPRRS